MSTVINYEVWVILQGTELLYDTVDCEDEAKVLASNASEFYEDRNAFIQVREVSDNDIKTIAEY